MPSVTPKQHNLMEYVLHTPGAAAKTGVPRSVAADYIKADKWKKLKGMGSYAGKTTSSKSTTEVPD